LGRGGSEEIKNKIAGGRPATGHFSWLAKKSDPKKSPRFTAPAGYPALLDWSGGCGTRATRSNSPRRNPLTSLRYSAALRGGKAKP